MSTATVKRDTKRKRGGSVSEALHTIVNPSLFHAFLSGQYVLVMSSMR
jgi:hypothetical protein